MNKFKAVSLHTIIKVFKRDTMPSEMALQSNREETKGGGIEGIIC
jgi:hypothetical protein